MIPLAQVVQLNPRPPKGLDDSREISFLAMASISENGEITHQETRSFRDVKKGFTYFQRGDVLLAKITPCFENGKSAHTNKLEHQIGFGSTEFHVLRAIPEKLNAKFLSHVVRSNRLRFLGKKSMKGAAGHKRVPADFLENFEIPDWHLDDQIRIAHLLGKVESLIAQRKKHLQELDRFLESVFLEMFGDPVRNEKAWNIEPCEKVVLDISSGTSYGGEDRDFLNTEELGVLKISAVTKGTFDQNEFKVVSHEKITKELRFVKRGDFLFSRANTADLIAACCIAPQDYTRLFLPDKLWVLTLNTELVNPQFFNYLLKNERYRAAVRSLASGGHDSMLNISMKKFMTLGIPCPLIDFQNKFAAIVAKAEGIKSLYQQSLTDLEAVYGALSQQALKGELDLSHVPLPSEEPEQETPLIIDPVQASIEEDLSINLPDTGNLINALENIEARKELIDQWLESYRDQLGATPFSLQRFMTAAQTSIAERHPDNNFDMGADQYELIKAWAFKAIASGMLTQEFDDAGNRVQLKTVQS